MTTLQAALLAACCGCAETPSGPAAGTPLRTQPDDPCALQLHDVSGAILLYQVRNHALPEKLEDILPFFPGGSATSLECPVARRPYEYDAKGWKTPGLAGRVIARDPTPTHGGHRWGILIMEGASGQPPSMRVLVVE